MTHRLFSPFILGSLPLSNRVVMAPMTRCRALGNIPNALMAEYYTQRATAGLLITEGVAPSAHGLGYARMPGIFSAEQIAGWRGVTESVHGAGGRLFMQIMHCGRVSHPANMAAGTRVLAPSAVALTGQMWTDAQGMQPYPLPEAMSEADIQATIAEFAAAARAAVEAGCDGVELHGANGYLIDQFFNTATNQRGDSWGGSVANRCRFAVEVARAAVAAVGAEKVGMRISPYGAFNDMVADSETDALYLHLIDQLNELGLLYIHIVDHSAQGAPEVSPTLKAAIRARFKGSYILSGGYDAARAEADLSADRGDLVAFGRPFISNPTLVAQLQSGAPLTPPDPATFYTPSAAGYTDYA